MTAAATPFQSHISFNLSRLIQPPSRDETTLTQRGANRRALAISGGVRKTQAPFALVFRNVECVAFGFYPCSLLSKTHTSALS